MGRRGSSARSRLWELSIDHVSLKLREDESLFSSFEARPRFSLLFTAFMGGISLDVDQFYIQRCSRYLQYLDEPAGCIAPFWSESGHLFKIVCG